MDVEKFASESRCFEAVSSPGLEAVNSPGLMGVGAAAASSSSSGGQAAPSVSSRPPPRTRIGHASSVMRYKTLHLTPSWFSVNMGTGITSILLHQLPYQFRGLGIISNVIFGLNVVLFFIFFAMSIARYTVWPRMGPTMLFHPTQSLFLGTFAMGFATIVNMCALSAAPAWNSPAFVTFTWAIWWIDVIISVAVCTSLPFLQFTRHVQAFEQVTGVWLLPLVSPIVAAASGGIVAPLLGPAAARLTITVSYMLWGMGFGSAFLVMALYYGRQAFYKIPPAAVIVSCFLPLGPCGQGAFGLLKIAASLREVSERDGRALGGSTSVSATDAHIMATAIYGVSMPIALVIWGLGLFWLVLAVSSLFDLARVSRLQFNLGWWGFTFPLGVFCTATTQFALELDSGAFRILGTVLSLIEVALWIVVASMTFMQVCQGKL